MTNLHKNAFWIFFLQAALPTTSFLAMFEIAYLNSPDLYHENALWINQTSIFTVFFAALLFLIFYAKLKYKFFLYNITSKDIRKESGIIIKNYTSIPFNKIQNVNIKRGILERIFGLSTLQIETAGLSGGTNYYGKPNKSEGEIPCLDKKEAEKIREKLIEIIS
jgi:uncharacterized membrane protein YdbT with pleckstrin-like domain